MCVIDPYCIDPNATIRDAMTCIDKNGNGICLVVDGERHLLGPITDGDIRRAILRGTNLDLPVSNLIEERIKSGKVPFTVPPGTSDAQLLQFMNKHDIRQVPIIDAEGRVLDISFLPNLVQDYELPLTAVVMAGGFGTRLRPLTDNTPKPMLPIGGRPMLQRTIEQLKKTGIRTVNLTTHFRSETISDHFGNGEEFGVTINYVHEKEPLGTAGALGLLGEIDGPLLVINGDILTQVDFRAMLDYHRKHSACLTVGVRQYVLQVPYGVVECNGPNVSQISEKPKLQFLVNAGIYLLEPSARKYIPAGRTFDMTDLIQSLLTEKRSVVSFPIVEYWLDVGRPADYERAQEDIRTGRIS